ncbi:MAG: LysM peptidoglycan-binding domain-containing protein, partial [Oscillospiraceae bacterium]
INEEQGKKKQKAALTIYFSQGGENVWDIARRYNTTVEAIMRENSLADEQVSEKAMLLIPGI